MSRFDAEYESGGYNNEYDLWEANLRRALEGKRGKKALAELREGLLHLPEKKLVSGAFSSVGLRAYAEQKPDDLGFGYGNWWKTEALAKVDEEGEGVCAVGAFAWWKKVQKGIAPDEAFRQLPRLLDLDEGGPWETAYEGKRAGLTYVLAYHLAYLNDETWGTATPTERYEKCLAWIDEQLAS